MSWSWCRLEDIVVSPRCRRSRDHEGRGQDKRGVRGTEGREMKSEEKKDRGFVFDQT